MRRPTIVGTLVGASLLTLLSAGSVASGGWYGPTRVVADDYPVSPSVVLKAGVFHAAYLHTQPIGGDVANGIFYASTQTGVWTKERVTTGDDFYARPSIAVDDQRHAFIVFARGDPEASRILLASNETGSWVVKPITATLDRFDVAPNLAFSGDDLWLTFYRMGRGVFFGSDAGGSWTFTRIATTVGLCPIQALPSLAVGPGGKPWVAYEAGRSPASGCLGGASAGIRVATRDGTTWSTQTVTTSLNDLGPDLATGGSGRPQLSIQRAGSGVLLTKRDAAGSWIPLQWVAAGDDATLAVDASNKAHLAYEGPAGVEYATNRSGSWARIPLTDYSIDFGTSSPPVVLLTGQGKARVLYARSESDGSEESLGLYLAREP